MTDKRRYLSRENKRGDKPILPSGEKPRDWKVEKSPAEAPAVARKDAKTLREKVSVKMTCEKTVRFLHHHFGVGAVRLVPRQNPKWQNQWEWYCVCESARFVINRIRPYMVTKADAADTVISYYDAKKRAAT